jgi:hypothetical protein
MRPQKRAEKAEKISGYTLLAAGFILIIIAVALVILMLFGVMQVPQLVPAPSGASDYVQSMAIFSNVCLIFFIYIIMVWAGSILSSRGVTMIKDVKLKLVRKGIQEAAETAEKVETED